MDIYTYYTFEDPERILTYSGSRLHTCHESLLHQAKFGVRTGSVAVLNTSRSMIAIHRRVPSAVWRTCFARPRRHCHFSFSSSVPKELYGKTSQRRETTFGGRVNLGTAALSLVFICKDDWRTHVASVTTSRGFRNRRLISPQTRTNVAII